MVPKAKRGPVNKGSVTYTALYGSAKGQYLETIKNETGHIISEKIVPEATKIKNGEETEVSANFARQLNEMKTLATSLTKLHNIGKRRGSLSTTNQVTFNTQMDAMKDACDDFLELFTGLNGVYDQLFAKKTRKVVKKNEEHYDYVEQEGVGIDASQDPTETSHNDEGTIAEAKPVGLAVVGESGLASSRPVATAISASGIALARPVATAIAGLDPAQLGLSFEINHKGE